MPRKQTKAKKPAPIAKPAEEKSNLCERWAEKFDELNLSELNSTHRAFMAVAYDLYERQSGILSGFEDLVMDLLGEYMWNRRPDPDYVEEQVKDFRSQWEHQLEEIRDFTAAYPDVDHRASTEEAAQRGGKKVRDAA